MTTATPIVEALCRMPEDFKRRGDISMINLLKESGYLSSPSQVTEEALRRYVEARPEVVDCWVALSEDQRTSEGWYLLKPDYPEAQFFWVVGFYPGGPRKRYVNGARACAAYIKRYVDDLSKYAKTAS